MYEKLQKNEVHYHPLPSSTLWELLFIDEIKA
jgi:hypothetical protein